MRYGGRYRGIEPVCDTGPTGTREPEDHGDLYTGGGAVPGSAEPGDRAGDGDMKYRPLIRYYGGKSRISGWVLSHFPKHRVYTEAFGGAASCLLRKERSYAEIYNDLNGELVNLFRVVRDNGEELLRKIKLTPFSRQEMLEAYDHSIDPVEQARRTIVKANMGHGSDSLYRQNGFRGSVNRAGSTPSHDWASYPSALARIIERFQGVVIESMEAVGVLEKYDSPDTLHYVDPPYLAETRQARHGYVHELTDLDHCAMSEVLHKLRGGVVLSGYPSPLYEDLYKGWRRVERESFAYCAKKRTEVLWIK